MMKIVVVGSGTGVPLLDRGSPCLLLMAGGEYTLFDLGPGALRQLLRIGVPHERIDRIFFTHFHPDHTADLVHFLFATRNPPVLATRRPFLLAGAGGLREFLEKLQKSYGKWLKLPDRTMGIDELEPMKPDRRDFKDFKVFSQPLQHTPHSLAYRVEEASGKSLVYSGDTGYSEELVDFAKGADLLVLECSFPEQNRVDHHLTPALAGRIAARANVKKLLVIHLYPEVLGSDMTGQIRLAYKGELVIGRDLLHVEVG
jgi:ribonuclease BN (tRNA processing enzyme)